MSDHIYLGTDDTQEDRQNAPHPFFDEDDEVFALAPIPWPGAELAARGWDRMSAALAEEAAQ